MKSTNLSFLCLLSSPVPKSQATSDMPPPTIHETSSTQTCGERDMDELEYFSLTEYLSLIVQAAAHLPDTSRIGSDTTPFVPPSELQVAHTCNSQLRNIQRMTDAHPLVSAIGLLASKPTLPAFLSFKTFSGSAINVVQQIGTHHSTLGPLLLNDDMGAVTATIVSQHHQNADAINQEILTRWLHGQGKQPVTWSTVIDVLRDAGLSELTKIIQEGLNSSSIQTSGE